MIKRGATHIEYETYATDNDDDDKRISTDYDYMKWLAKYSTSDSI